MVFIIVREYLACFKKQNIKVIQLNPKMFIRVFHNRLRVGHFNESLAQKPYASMAEVVTIAECYIKGEESNIKKCRHVDERPFSNPNSLQ